MADINLKNLEPRTIHEGDKIIGYSENKEVVILNLPDGDSNKELRGDLSYTDGHVKTLTFQFETVKVAINRINQAELTVVMSSDDDLSLNVTSTHYGPSSTLTEKKVIPLTPIPAVVETVTVGTYNKIEYDIAAPNNSYEIKGTGNSDLSDSRLKITKYIPA